MIVLAAARVVLPIASAWYALRGRDAPRLVRLYREARRIRQARRLLARANRAADRGANARSRRLIQRAAAVLDALDKQGRGTQHDPQP